MRLKKVLEVIMKNKVYLFMPILLLLLSACTNKVENSAAKSTLFIQLVPNSVVISTIIETITPLINQIIKEELGLGQEYDFEFFLPKKRQALTLYAINDMYQDGEQDFLAAFELVKKDTQKFASSGVTIASEVDFFGGQFDEKDELVIMIADPNGMLLHCNEQMKEMVHMVDQEYKKIHNHNLYDIAKSEQYSYVPHIGLGRIRSNSIKEHLKEPSHFEHLQQRIKAEVLSVVGKLIFEGNSQLSFDKICIFDLQKWSCVRESFVK
jgi:hypothetical protein